MAQITIEYINKSIEYKSRIEKEEILNKIRLEWESKNIHLFIGKRFYSYGVIKD